MSKQSNLKQDGLNLGCQKLNISSLARNRTEKKISVTCDVAIASPLPSQKE